jgi:hypothetical protein
MSIEYQRVNDEYYGTVIYDSILSIGMVDASSLCDSQQMASGHLCGYGRHIKECDRRKSAPQQCTAQPHGW